LNLTNPVFDDHLRISTADADFYKVWKKKIDMGDLSFLP
jgi:hypothetical protein